MKTIISKDAELILIPRDKIVASSLNSYEISDVDDLVGSIKTCGLIQPLAVIGPNKDGIYEVLSGERRLTALTRIYEESGDYDKIPCHVLAKDMGELEQRLVIEMANIEVRSDFDRTAKIFEILDILKAMKKDEEVSSTYYVKELEKYVGASDRYRRAIVSLNENGDEKIKEMVKNGQGTVMNMSAIAGLNPEDKNRLVKEIEEGKSSAKVLSDYRAEKKERQEKMKQALKEDYDLSYNEDTYNDDSGYGSHISSSAPFVGVMELDDIMNHISGGLGRAGNVLNNDTSGLFNELSKEESYTETLSKVKKWCIKMKKKEDYTSEEKGVLKFILELAKHLKEVGNDIA